MNNLPSGRLPDTVRPSLYETRINLLLKEKRFEGEVRIHLEIQRPVENILIHSLELEISHVEIQMDGEIERANLKKALKLSLKAAKELNEIQRKALKAKYVEAKK